MEVPGLLHIVSCLHQSGSTGGAGGAGGACGGGVVNFIGMLQSNQRIRHL